jgi:hypothetical protein
MDVLDKLDFVRLAALANEHAQDARLWRWFANMLEDGRLAWLRDRKSWEIYIDGACVTRNASFDVALRFAYAVNCEGVPNPGAGCNAREQLVAESHV